VPSASEQAEGAQIVAKQTGDTARIRSEQSIEQTHWQTNNSALKLSVEAVTGAR
jgi:hypothetical protein